MVRTLLIALGIAAGVWAVSIVGRKAGPDAIAEHWSGDQATLGIFLRVAGER